MSRSRPASLMVKVCVYAALLVSFQGCAIRHQWQATQTAIQQNVVSEEQTRQQLQILQASVEALHQQLEQQQKLLEAKPQVVEKPVTKIICPARIVPPAPKLPPVETPVTDKLIVGLREQVLLNGLNMMMPARINTGVVNSILDARNIQLFERNGEEWVRFTLYDPDTKEPHVLERKRVRFQNLATTPATTDKRPVVEMRFTLGKLTQKGDFILADRRNSDFPLLIGRNILRDIMLVDVSADNLAPVQRLESSDASSSAAAH